MDYKKFKRRINLWLKKKVGDAGKKGFVVGISGGVDSSVVAVLCKEAIGRKNLLCLILPCETSKEDEDDTKFFAKRFKLLTRTVDLTGIYKNIIKILPSGNKLSRGNLKPRLRMLILYYFANKLNYIVAGTGNKSELLIGYFTKYGDGGVDILPIGDLYKSEVKKLAQTLGISEKIVRKTPTAGLWKGQTDEREIGMSYDELEWRLENKRLNKELKKLTESTKHKLSSPEMFKS